MARRIRAREVLRLRSVNGLSQNAIARTAHVSKHSVQDVLEAARERGVSWEDVEGMSEEAAYALLFPGRGDAGPVHADPDWARVHRELARTGVTLKLLHAEYADGCAEAGAPSMSYDRFCKRYRQYTVSRNVVSRVGHKAGRNMEVDWSGPTMRLVDPATGEVRKVYLFVACLPFSRYSYVEPTLDMKQDTWLLCHVHAFSFLGGATPCIVPDNLRTGVTAHPRAGEPVLNAAYEELAAHYGSPKLREMGAAELLAALSAQDEAVRAGMAFAERVQMAVDEAHSDFITQKVRNLTRRAGLRYPEADVRSVDFFEGRGLDRVAVAELATCGFVGRGENVVLQGLTGTGKTYLACALAKAACARRVRSCYVRQPDLEDLWRESRDRPGGERKLVRKYGAFGLLVIDEWLLDRPDTEFRSMLLELMELRYGTASTVFCTQFKKKDWHPRLGGGVHADAIMDRIVHNAVWVDMGEANMRQRRG